MLAAVIAVSVLVATFVASLAALVATFLSSMRQAGQTVGGILIFLLVTAFFLVQAMPPAWQEAIAGVLNAAEAAQIAAVVAAALIALNAVLLFLASLRFRRDRLVLD